MIILLLLGPEERCDPASQVSVWPTTSTNFAIRALSLAVALLVLTSPEDYLAKILHIGLLLLQLQEWITPVSVVRLTGVPQSGSGRFYRYYTVIGTREFVFNCFCNIATRVYYTVFGIFSPLCFDLEHLSDALRVIFPAAKIRR